MCIRRVLYTNDRYVFHLAELTVLNLPARFPPVFYIAIALLLALTGFGLAHGTTSNGPPTPIELSQPEFDAHHSSFLALENIPADWSFERVSSLTFGSFKTFDASKTYPVSINKALWLRFTVPAKDALHTYPFVFELPKSYVDRVEFYYRNSDGRWAKQVAGELTPRTQWPLTGLYPRFEVPHPSTGVSDVYVKVLQFTPLRAALQVVPKSQSDLRMQLAIFMYGLTLGLMVLMSAYSLLLAATYRRYVYAWYSIYALLTALAIASYAGIGHLLIWPASTDWAEKSILVTILAGLAAQVQFCRVLFFRDGAARWLDWSALSSVVLSAACIAMQFALPLNEIDNRLNFFYLALVGSSLMLILITGKAIYSKNKVAWLWVLATVPLLTLILLSVAEGVAGFSMPLLPFNAVVYTAAFESVVLMIAMQIHVKASHQAEVVDAAMDVLDPLTGFIAPQHFEEKLKVLWEQAELSRTDLAVVYAQISLHPLHSSTGAPFSHEQSIKRVVRILHMASREVDTIALVAGNVFAILMPGVSPSENLNTKLSRLVALGLMPDKDDPKAAPVYIRIAASSMCSFFGTRQALDELLFKTLRNTSQWQNRSIRIVRD